MKISTRADVIATKISGEMRLDSRRPEADWERTDPVCFSADWQGRNADPALETEVRVLWSDSNLYLRFVCRYKELFVFDDSDPSGRRDHLWDRDVAEAFLQPVPSGERYYKEFEVAPNGMWIDLDITPSGLADLKSGLQRSAHVDEGEWVAELAIPIRSITASFDPDLPWHANFYRVEGKAEPRRYLAWRPTNTPQPNFHVPAAFGILWFRG